MADTPPASVRRRIDIRTLIGIPLVFLLIGPAVGAVAFGLLSSVMMSWLEPESGMGGLFLISSIVALPLAYLVGGLQALVTGIVTAVVRHRIGRVSLLAALAAAAVTSIFHAARISETDVFLAVIVAVHLIAALVCALIARAIFDRR